MCYSGFRRLDRPDGTVGRTPDGDSAGRPPPPRAARRAIGSSAPGETGGAPPDTAPAPRAPVATCDPPAPYPASGPPLAASIPPDRPICSLFTNNAQLGSWLGTTCRVQQEPTALAVGQPSSTCQAASQVHSAVLKRHGRP